MSAPRLDTKVQPDSAEYRARFAHNRALASDPRWAEDPAAQCWLWKDHTSWWEAAEITRTAAEHRPHFIAMCGATYSSEWFWAKIWHCLRTSPDVFEAAHSWVELADWIPSVLAGSVIDPDNHHPTVEGHAYLGTRLAASVRLVHPAMFD